MVTKAKSKASGQSAKKRRIEIPKLTRETIKDLSGREKKKIKGGGVVQAEIGPHCSHA